MSKGFLEEENDALQISARSRSWAADLLVCPRIAAQTLAADEDVCQPLYQLGQLRNPLKDKAFEILCLGHGVKNGVVRCLSQGGALPQPDSSVVRGRAEDVLKCGNREILRATAGQQDAVGR